MTSNKNLNKTDKLKRMIFSFTIIFVALSYLIIYTIGEIEEGRHEHIKLGFTIENNTIYNLKIVEKKLDRKVDIFHIFQKINETPKVDTIQDALDDGYITLLTIEPWEGYDANYSKYLPLRILNGSIDSDIDKWKYFLNNLKYRNGQLIIRIGHEPNGDWHPWAAFWESNTLKDSKNEYRYIIDRLRNDKLLFIWSVNRKTFGYKRKMPSFKDFYPGDSYVDIIGISGYNRRIDNWMSFSYIYDEPYNELSYFEKPIWIVETSSISIGGNKAEWINDAFFQIKNNYPNIKAIIWFNENKLSREYGYIMDWQFDSSNDSREIFAKHVKIENMRR